MSRFFSSKYASLTPYVPGEQPGERKYVKLNTNESPFPPSPKALHWAARHTRSQELYSDPEGVELRAELAKTYGVKPEETILVNGSDEVLNFAFMAFCDDAHSAWFPDITYGFYPVFAGLNRVPYTEIPLREDFTLDPADYRDKKGVLFIANPNAPTGILLPPSKIEALLRADPERLVVVDEAYVDFGGLSCVPLVHQYDNLLVVQTFSKSRSLAGARLGFAIGCEALIRDLNTIRYSTNPYNVNSMTLALGLGTLLDPEYMKKNCAEIVRVREQTAGELKALGFTLTDSKANFLFARSDRIGGEALYRRLKEKGILIRHFTLPRIADYNRITVGTLAQMEALLNAIREILEEPT
ncbi:MAG: histidinol-phosphate transaminase [Oscillospiraceae bacterium]|nr:histidinol-phosphate transaminase [Oscillospiraceae bacterium]